MPFCVINQFEEQAKPARRINAQEAEQLTKNAEATK